MLFKWIKKKVLQSIIKDVTKEHPKYKEISLIYVEQNINDILNKVKKAIGDIIKNELGKV